jgi:phosphate transport system substrate-binding protein
LLAAPVLALCGVGLVRAEEIKIGGTGSALATMQLLANAYAKSHPETRITVLPSLGSSGGIKAVLSGAIQLAVSSRPLNDAEIKQGAVEIEYGRTPFVFATSVTNEIAGLTVPELVGIYAGKTDKWPDGRKIRLVLRPIGDSDSEMIRSISPEMRAAKSQAEQRQGMLFAVTDQETADSIEKIPGALGPSTLVQILSEKRALKALKLNGVTPSAKAIADGSYPLYKQLFFVTNPKGPPSVQQFVAFVRSASGREILRQTGHLVR